MTIVKPPGLILPTAEEVSTYVPGYEPPGPEGQAELDAAAAEKERLKNVHVIETRGETESGLIMVTTTETKLEAGKRTVGFSTYEEAGLPIYRFPMGHSPTSVKQYTEEHHVTDPEGLQEGMVVHVSNLHGYARGFIVTFGGKYVVDTGGNYHYLEYTARVMGDPCWVTTMIANKRAFERLRISIDNKE